MSLTGDVEGKYADGTAGVGSPRTEEEEEEEEESEQEDEEQEREGEEEEEEEEAQEAQLESSWQMARRTSSSASELSLVQNHRGPSHAWPSLQSAANWPQTTPPPPPQLRCTGGQQQVACRVLAPHCHYATSGHLLPPTERPPVGEDFIVEKKSTAITS